MWRGTAVDYVQDIWRETSLLQSVAANLSKPLNARAVIAFRCADVYFGKTVIPELLENYKKLFGQELGLKVSELSADEIETDYYERFLLVEGVFAFLPLEKFPADIRPSKAAAHTSLRLAVARLRGQAVLIDDLSITNSTVERAIQDAEVLIREQGNTSGIDRVHTALYGYLRALCKHHGVPIEEQADATRLLKLLRTNAPALQPAPGRDADVLRVQGGLASIVGALNPIRNQASLAHPNETLLDVPEAGLVIDAARTIVNYLNRKLR